VLPLLLNENRIAQASGTASPCPTWLVTGWAYAGFRGGVVLGVAGGFRMVQVVVGEEGSDLGGGGSPGPEGVAAREPRGGPGGEGDLLVRVGAEDLETGEVAVWGRVVKVGFVAGGVVAPHGPAGLVGGDGAELGSEVLGWVGGEGDDPFGEGVVEGPG